LLLFDVSLAVAAKAFGVGGWRLVLLKGMTHSRFRGIVDGYPDLAVAVLGDFCLDRYLEIDPAKKEVSLETGLPVHNVVSVRGQPGGAGTVLNNLVALGVGEIFAVGFCGEDGEGYELQRALRELPGVSLEHFFPSTQRRTFTYTKPLVMQKGTSPRELNRLDLKNWTPTPAALRQKLTGALRTLAPEVDAIIVLDQTDVAETGVVTNEILDVLGALVRKHPKRLVLADSRRGLRDFPPCAFKMNAAELAACVDSKRRLSLAQIKIVAHGLAQRNNQPVFVTLAQRGLLAAAPEGEIEHVPALPVRGKIDIVGAGDAVSANLATALAAGATLREALEIANAAASIVIHQLGTTGTARVAEVGRLLTRRRH
jgi:rfaE bifunctional protein kinase chain/domain